MALTDIPIKKAKTKEKPYRLSDGGGLYLSLTPAGGKLWRWGYVYEGKEKLMSFGATLRLDGPVWDFVERRLS